MINEDTLSGVSVEAVSFTSEGETISAILYLPSGAAPVRGWPAVVTGPGFGGVKEMLIDEYAMVLARRGIACLSLDFRHWGASGGAPRQDLNPERQIADLEAGLDYLAGRDGIDRNRLGIWGTSMSGGHTLSLAATNHKVRAAVAILPFLRAPIPKPFNFLLVAELILDAAKSLVGMRSNTIPIFAERPGMRAVMTSDGGWEWMQQITRSAPTYRNVVTVRSLRRVMTYRPETLAQKIPIPTLLISAKDDLITPSGPIARFADRMRVAHDLHEFPGSHFELFGVHLMATTGLTADWFTKYL